jgi:endo-1,4-beta-xylanase
MGCNMTLEANTPVKTADATLPSGPDRDVADTMVEWAASDMQSAERRTFLRNVALSLGMAPFVATLAGRALAKGADAFLDPSTASVSTVPLRMLAQKKNLLYGASSSQNLLSSDAPFAALFAEQCGILVPEVDLKFASLSKEPHVYDFTRADWLVNFARKAKMAFRGHTLVWHGALPPWFVATVNQSNAEKFLRQHIATVAGRYAGGVHSWDVVNEATNPREGGARGLRVSSPWYRSLGEKYIEIAFEAAAQADPKAMLVYNDYALEYDHPEEEQKRNAVLRLLERLKMKGVPLHALGIQAHLYGKGRTFNPALFRRFLKQVSDLDLKILITELDVADNELPASFFERDSIVARDYSDFLSVALAEPAVVAVLTWGLTDRYSWIPYSRPRKDKMGARPLPFDLGLHPKPVYFALKRALMEAPPRKL